MTKALVTIGVGGHRELLDIALPSFYEFADRHDYVLVEPVLESDRPPSWWKIPALISILQEFDEALWVGADVVIVDPTEDLDVPEGKWHALVEHHTGDGHVPNCDVWFVRRPMIPWLEKAWGLTHRINHGWWEQAAIMDLLGYKVDRPAGRVQTTELLEHTCWLDHGWNVHAWDTPGPEHPRFMHATMHPDRAAVMREWADGNVPEVPDLPCRHMYPQVGNGCRYC